MTSQDQSASASQPHIEGREFDEPVIIQGTIEREPERYVAEKPYDLTRYEYSVLKRPFTGDFWLNVSASATAGVLIAVVGKAILALIRKETPQIETWEIVALLMGACTVLLVKLCLKSPQDEERNELLGVVDRHFSVNRPRRLHITRHGGDSNEN